MFIQYNFYQNSSLAKLQEFENVGYDFITP